MSMVFLIQTTPPLGRPSGVQSPGVGMVVQLLGLRGAPQPPDVADALALAIAFANIDAQRTRFGQAGIVLRRPRPRTRATR